ncbi:MAG: amidohydrolase family protein [Chloroflexi bacterium]|nr:amidohydrolase family protein [Chloroflexota bacterium]MBU1746942.1 amidohydrolase family protein [Chloroflexota bacterium]MBU1879212.1 amidohydrolase family protein [Chloroflexota bacterium]
MTIRLPGLADVHAHLRVPGGEHKEDFGSGTAAALAGGFTTVLAMPNTSPPLVTADLLRRVQQQANAEALCDVHLYAGASPAHTDELPALGRAAVALKIYLNETFGPLRVTDLSTLLACFRHWPIGKPIAMHAEGPGVAVGLGLAAAFGRPVHICHVSRASEIALIAAAKARGVPVTCEVTPHHLFLTQANVPRLGPLGDMRPPLAEPADVAALWAHIDTAIDCVATDHAPHTLAEKHSENPPPGVPGLETALPLMLTAVADGRLTLDRLVALLAQNPRRIFHLPEQPDTWVEIDPAASYQLSNEGLLTKCGWTPFAGMTVRGRVQRVVLRGKLVFEDGKVRSDRDVRQRHSQDKGGRS